MLPLPETGGGLQYSSAKGAYPNCSNSHSFSTSTEVASISYLSSCIAERP